MGLFDYFRRRRARESAIRSQDLAGPDTPNTGAADIAFDPEASGESIAAAVSQAKRASGPGAIHDAVHQAFAYRTGSEAGGNAGGFDYGQLQQLQNSVLAIMKAHGIDPMRPDPSKFMDPEVQRALQEAVREHGFGAAS